MPYNIDDIKLQFSKVVEYSQGIINPDLDNLFKNWYNTKKKYISSFGEKLIWEWPEEVSFEMNEKEKERNINEFVDLVTNSYGFGELGDFIEAQREGFYINRTVSSYRTFNGVEIPAGVKLGKAFKFFLNPGSTALNELQIKLSREIQKSKITGKLCLSVHPLDYLSLSENAHNWRSCHALDGDYRSGNLSYMVDSSTIICYLKTKDDEKLPGFPNSVPWNSKKWRVLLYFSNDEEMLFAGRQYPFTTDAGLNFVKERVLPVIGLHQWSPWTDEKITKYMIPKSNIMKGLADDYIGVGSVLKPMRQLVKDELGSLQFNDLLKSTCYNPKYAYKMSEFLDWVTPGGKDSTEFRVGGAVRCLQCGNHYISSPETMRCTDCEINFGDNIGNDFDICPACDRRFLAETGVWVDTMEELICPDCAHIMIGSCSRCGQTAYQNQLRFHIPSDLWLCGECLFDLDEEDEEKI